jgi:hypothetical protein
MPQIEAEVNGGGEAVSNQILVFCCKLMAVGEGSRDAALKDDPTQFS